MFDLNKKYYVEHKDGSKQNVNLLYHSADNNYYKDRCEKWVNRNAKFNEYPFKKLYEVSKNINEIIEEYLYKSLPENEKMYYVEKINNIPFTCDNCFYVKGKYIKQYTIKSRVINFIKTKWRKLQQKIYQDMF